jgi:hypothetical protein
MRCEAKVFASLRGSRGGRQATQWSSKANRAMAQREGGGCGYTLRQQRCSGGQSWLGEGPTAPKKGGDGEDSSKSKQCREMVVLTVKGGGNVVVMAILPLPASSDPTARIGRRPGRLGGDDARFWWLSCGEEGKVGDKCSAAPCVEAEKKLGEVVLGAHQLKGGGGVRYSAARRREGPVSGRTRAQRRRVG